MSLISCREHIHHATYNIICTEVFLSQCLQHHTAGVQRHRHDEEHTEVEKQRILRYSLVVI